MTSPRWPEPRTVVIPQLAGEVEALTASLDFYRESIALKCADLTAAQLSDPVMPPSDLTLHGLVRHLSAVERWWFAINFAGLDLPMLFYTEDDPDQDFEHLDGDPQLALAVWAEECARSRLIVAAAPDGLDTVGARILSGGAFSLRWLLLRQIAEYAQHLGHADLLREGLDGRTGY